MPPKHADKSRNPDRRNIGKSLDARGRGLRPLGALLSVVLFAAVILVYWPALSAEFLNWDDADTISRNEHYRGLSADHLQWMFTTGHMGHYQPLAWLSFAIDHALWEMKASGYHLTSVILHAVNTILVFLLALQLMMLARSSTPHPQRLFDGSTLAASFFAAMLFGIHPMRVESVVWITERRDVLSGLFAIACVMAYIQFARDRSTFRTGWYIASLALFSLALLSKAITLTLPAILLVLDWYPLRRDLRQRGVWLEKIPFAFLSAVIAAAILTIQQSMIRPVDDHPLVHRIAQSLYGLVYYPRAAVWPVNLLPLYEFPITMRMLEGRYVLSAAAVIVAMLILVWNRRRWPAVVAAAAAYLLTVGPVLGLLQTGPQFVADRYSYLSLIGMAIVVAAGLRWVLQQRRTELRVTAVVAGAIAMVVLGVLTNLYASQWTTSASLWSYTLAIKSDHAVAHACYGAVLKVSGEENAATPHFQAALDLRPDMPEPALNLGITLLSRNQVDQAVSMFQQALKHNPAHPELNRRLGDALQRKKDFAGAVACYENAIRGGGDSLSLHNNFANALAAVGRLEQAAEHYRIALRLDPTRAQTYVNLALDLWQINPNDAEIGILLGQAHHLEPDSPSLRAAIDQTSQPPATAPVPQSR